MSSSNLESKSLGWETRWNVLASSVHRRLLIKISFAGKNQSSLDRVIRGTVGIDVNRDGLRTALLTGPAVDVCAGVINSNAVNVADDATGLRVLRCCFRTGQHCEDASKKNRVMCVEIHKTCQVWRSRLLTSIAGPICRRR